MKKLDKKIGDLRHALKQKKSDREMRYPFARVTVTGGFVYASDAHILFKAPAYNYIDDPALIENKAIDFDTLAKISKAKNVETDGEYLYIDGARYNFSDEIKDRSYYKPGQTGALVAEGTVPDFECVLPTRFGQSHSVIGIDIELLFRLSKCFRESVGMKLEFTEDRDNPTAPRRAIKVTTVSATDFGEWGIIMPQTVNGQ